MGYRVITVTPAGRKPYLEILAAHLLKQREHIDEHHFWVNTRNQEDIEYLEELAGQYPDFFQLKRRAFYEVTRPNNSIWQYFQDCLDDDTIYIRLDDDICYIEPDAIETLAKFRADQREPFLILGNIVNNAICSYYQQQRGLIPQQWGRVERVCMSRVGWDSKRFAQRLHTLFLEDIRKGKTQRWKFSPQPLDDYCRFSINAICWFGEDMKRVPELAIQDLYRNRLLHYDGNYQISNEEEMLTMYLPAKFGRPNVICGDALFGHFAFYPQRAYLEGVTTLLDDYRDLIDPEFARTHKLQRQMERVVKPLTIVRSERAWKFLRRKAKARFS